MAIVSISLNDNILSEIDRIQTDEGYSGRSEVIRAAVRDMISQNKTLDNLNGIVEGVIIVVNDERHNESISDIRHSYSEIIRTQIHNHLESHKCLQIFVIHGNASKVSKLVKELKASGKTEYTKLYVS